MIYIAVAIAMGIALCVFAVARGQKAVKAFVYIGLRSEGESIAEANYKTSRIDTGRASELTPAMLDFVNTMYRGKQLPMISDARMDGFTG